MTNNERINDIIIKFLSGECEADEEKELINWRDSSDENAAYFQKIKYIWVSAAQLRSDPVFEADTALEQFRNTIPAEEKVFHFNFRKLLKYAAVFLLIFSTGYAASIIFRNKTNIPQVSQSFYEIPIGSKGSLILPDGTKVWLNAGSKLNYATNYNTKERIVKLEGEGYFDVVTNPDKPFIVEAKGLKIKAYGTSFNVKAYTDEKEVITTLVKGRVLIEGENKQHKLFTIEMKPKQTVTYFTEEQMAQSVNSSDISKGETEETPKATHSPDSEIPVVKENVENIERFTSWKDNRWIIENEELTSLLKQLERRYDVNITVKGEDLNKFHFSGTIENESIEQVLSFLRLTLPIKYKIDKDRIELTLDPLLKTRFFKAL